jgi:hypothetical protein
VQLAKNDATTLCNLARASIKAGRLLSAYKHLKSALYSSPGHREAQELLSDILEELEATCNDDQNEDDT